MHIEILTFDGCPNAIPARDRVREAACLEAVDATIDFIEVDTADLAERLRFLGSPSVRVDGDDVDPLANERTEYGLMCRTYACGTAVEGVPPIAMIRAAIQRHVNIDRVKDTRSSVR